MICKECKQERKHMARGMCGSCYAKWYRRTYPKKRIDYYERNKKMILVKGKVYYKKNKKRLNEYARIYIKDKYKNSPSFYRLAEFRRKTRYLISLKGKCCVNCGSTKNLQRHHLSYDDLTNIIILCRKCHNFIHMEIKGSLLKG